MNEEEIKEKIKYSIQINNITKEISGNSASINVQVLETVLNILEKKDRTIQQLKDENKTLNKQAQQYFETTIIQSQQYDKETTKKGKIIDEMANYICSKSFDDITNRLKDDDIAYWGVEGSIKQYFKEKVENGN